MAMDAVSKDLFKFVMVAVLLLASIGDGASISVGPGESIQSAIDDANDGDVILVQSGVYRENLNVDKQLTLEGEEAGGEKPVIDAGGDRNGITLTADNVTIQGFCVTDARIGIDVVSSNNAIIGNEVRDSWTGIALRSSSRNVLKDNLARDGWRGIYLKDSAGNSIIGNSVRDNKWSGIVLESSNGNLVKENLIRTNYRGIEKINSDENTFVDNELAMNKYNDEPRSVGSTRDLEDIVGEPSLETPSERIETEPLGTIGAGTSQADGELPGEVHEDYLGGSVDETKPVESRMPEAEDTSLKIKAPLDTDEGHLKSIIVDEIDEPVSEDAFSDIEYERDDPGEDLPVESSDKVIAETYAEIIEPETASQGSSATGPVAETASEVTYEEPLRRDDAESEPIEETLKTDGPESEPIEEAGHEESEKEVPAVGAEEDVPIEEMNAQAVVNDTGGFVEGDGAVRTKSSSGGWKIYELLKSLGDRMKGEGTDSQPVLPEMNFSEMVEMEVERLDLGTVSFYSPKDMTVGVSEKVEAAIAKDVQNELKGSLEGLGAPEAEVAKLNLSIRSDLEGDNFRIQPLDDEFPFAANEGIARWSWYVTPIKSGVQDLSLHVAVVVDLSDGSQVRKEYPAIERRTSVDLSFGRIVLYLAERVSDFTSA